MSRSKARDKIITTGWMVECRERDWDMWFSDGVFETRQLAREYAAKWRKKDGKDFVYRTCKIDDSRSGPDDE